MGNLRADAQLTCLFPVHRPADLRQRNLATERGYKLMPDHSNAFLPSTVHCLAQHSGIADCCSGADEPHSQNHRIASGCLGNGQHKAHRSASRDKCLSPETPGADECPLKPTMCARAFEPLWHLLAVHRVSETVRRGRPGIIIRSKVAQCLHAHSGDSETGARVKDVAKSL